ncbi:MAG: conserved phage C-terminal domain-containing protein [Deltaproteobacteria bacterium]|nr:conserved phage C-terminal domain-containing protein [Deltaproteobacteria bacterium]
MSVKIMARVWGHSQQKGGELLVMLALADFANDAGESWPSIPTLADKSRLAERHTRRVLRNLESAGEIRRVGTNGGRNRRNHYFITVTENPDKITLLKKQGLNNPVICDTKTLTPTSGALNHHRTINKTGANAPDVSSPSRRGRKLTRGAGIPPELQEAVSRVVARINELGGTRYHDDKPDAIHNLLTRLRDGRTEAECLTVIEGRHAAWAGNDKMLEYFRPSTLFAKEHFDDYLQGAQRRGNGYSEGPPKIVKREGDMLTLADGSIMPAGTYQRKHGTSP